MSCILISVDNLDKCHALNHTEGGARFPALRAVVASHTETSLKAIGGKIRGITGPNGLSPQGA